MNLRRALLLAPIIATGCASPRSSLLDTAGFHVTYTLVHDEGSEPWALAEFRDRGDNGDALELVDGDRATVDDVVMLEKTATQRPTSDTAQEETFSYFAPVSPAQTHRFSLLRDGEAKTVHVIPALPLPEATIDGSKHATAEYPKPVLVTWTKVPGTRVSLSVTAADRTHCRSVVVEPESDDPGFYVIDSKTLRAGESSTACSFAIRVTRRRESPIGDPFIGGKLRAISTARLELELR